MESSYVALDLKDDQWNDSPVLYLCPTYDIRAMKLANYLYDRHENFLIEILPVILMRQLLWRKGQISEFHDFPYPSEVFDFLSLADHFPNSAVNLRHLISDVICRSHNQLSFWHVIPMDQSQQFIEDWVTLIGHDDVIKWKHFPRNWPFVRGFHRSPVNSPHKGQWRGALMISLICAWMNGRVNTRETGDLRRYRAHHDVIIMLHWSRSSFCSSNRLSQFGITPLYVPEL